MTGLRYEAIGPVSREEALEAVHAENPSLASIVLAVALHEPDQTWAQSFLEPLVTHEDSTVRGNAILGFGHLARLHRALDLGQAGPLVVAALEDSEPFVRGQAENARDDIEVFIGVRLA